MKNIKDKNHQVNGADFEADVNAFAHNGHFNRKMMAEYLGLDERGIDIEGISDVTTLFPVLLENIQQLDDDLMYLAKNTLDFLLTLFDLRCVDLDFFNDGEIIHYFVNHISYHDPEIGAMFVRLLNLIYANNINFIPYALEAGIFDQFNTLLANLGDGPYFDNHARYVIGGIIALIEISLKEIPEDTDTSQIWLLGTTLIVHPEQSTDTIEPGFYTLKLLCDHGFKQDLTEEFVNIIANFSNDGTLVLDSVFSFVVSYGQELVQALAKTEFFEDILENFESNSELAPSVLYFLSDVEYAMDITDHAFEVVCNYLSSRFPFRVRSAALHYFRRILTKFSNQQMAVFAENGFVSNILDLLVDENQNNVINGVAALAILLNTWKSLGMNLQEIPDVNEISDVIDNIDFSQNPEAEPAADEIFKIL